jgi:hypothetical protein
MGAMEGRMLNARAKFWFIALLATAITAALVQIVVTIVR